MKNKNLIFIILFIFILILMIFTLLEYLPINNNINSNNNNNIYINQYDSIENTLTSYSLIKSTYPNITEELYLENIADNNNVFMQLRKNNDDSNIEREIVHYVIYEDIETTKNFINEFKNEDYNLEVHDDTKYILIKINSKAQEDIINDQTFKILNKVIQYNLVYDGWETKIM